MFNILCVLDGVSLASTPQSRSSSNRIKFHSASTGTNIFTASMFPSLSNVDCEYPYVVCPVFASFFYS